MSKLEIKTVSKHYEKKKALDGFTFTFTKGIYGLLGPNGAGKTTLINVTVFVMPVLIMVVGSHSIY